MMKNNLIIKSLTCVLATGFVLGAFSYSQERLEPKKINLNGLRNALKNIESLSKKTENLENHNVAYRDVTASIVQTIEKEIKVKIYRSRLEFIAEKSASKYRVVSVQPIVKNWNEIKPEFEAAKMTNVESFYINSKSLNELMPNEINNKEMVKLTGYPYEDQLTEKFTNITIPSSYEEKLVTQVESEKSEVDEVKVTQAATLPSPVIIEEDVLELKAEQTISEEVATVESEEKSDDDMVMFDYSKKITTEAPKKIFNAPLSASVKEAIERELHQKSSVKLSVSTQKQKIETSTDKQALLDVMNDEDAIIYDYTTKTQAATKLSSKIENNTNAFADEESAERITFELSAKEVNLNTQKVRSATGFEFVPDYERSERTDDQAMGKITFDYSLNSNLSIQTGLIQSLGNLSTRIELDLMKRVMTVPLLNEEGIQKYLEKKSLNISGSLVMLAIDESIQDVEIDRDYQAKIYFNSKFKAVESKSGASYVMLLGIEPGNIMLRFILKNNDSSQKIIYVGDGELYYEDPGFKVSEREIYSFTTRSLLGKKVKELNIAADQVRFFGSKTPSKKKTLNAYEIKVPTIVDNERKYLEFKHMNSSLYVGTHDSREIEIPSLDFMNKVLDQKDMRQLGQRCLVQINLTKEVREVRANGKNKLGEMFVDTNYLDTDGNFSNETPEMAEKVFIGGDQEGLLNIRLDFTDGSTGFLKSYCSEGSYLVEQI